MSENSKIELRLKQILQLVEREDFHLQAIEKRFFDVEEPDAKWLEMTLETDAGVDRLESFVGKFTRMQDTLMDKLVPLFLKYVGEPVGTAVDNLNRMEKLSFIVRADDWLELRYLRNRLVHEYMDDSEVMALSLGRARLLSKEMHQLYQVVLATMEKRKGDRAGERLVER